MESPQKKCPKCRQLKPSRQIQHRDSYHVYAGYFCEECCYILFVIYLFIYLVFIISLLVISPSNIYNHKKREDTHMSSLISILSENAYLSILYIY